MPYKIENYIPIPSKGEKTETKIDILLTLLPGQSVLFNGSINANGFIVAIVGIKTGRRFTCRTVEGGVRVWRLPD